MSSETDKAASALDLILDAVQILGEEAHPGDPRGPARVLAKLFQENPRAAIATIRTVAPRTAITKRESLSVRVTDPALIEAARARHRQIKAPPAVIPEATASEPHIDIEALPSDPSPANP